MVTNPAQMISQYREFFERHNPFIQMMFDLKQFMEDVRTLPSRRKLSKYQCLLELERLEALQQVMESGSPYDPQGVRLDRPF